jgi:probable F420-dependent oxidoreductase
MHIGLTMFPTEYAIEPHVLAKEAEARGFESIWFPEHTHIPTSRRTPYPAGGDLPKEYWHTFDPFGALCAAAAVTNTINLGTGVCLLIERDTIITAKQAATVDQLSAGRFLFGIGGGWNAEEMENHGTDFKTRFKKLREQVLAIREIWTKEAAEFHGEMVRFDPIWCHPKPMQKPGPPIILGGMSAHAMDRAIDYGDGWMPLDGGRGPDSLSPMLGEFNRRLAARARASMPVTIFGAPQSADALSKYEQLGVKRAVLMIRPEPSDVLLPKLDRMAKLIPTSSSPRPS